MIPAQTERTVHAAETDSARFGISAADSVHLMTILRDNTSQIAAIRANQKNGHRMRAYFSSQCGCWHATRAEQR